MKCLFIQVMGFAGFPSHVSKENFDFLCCCSYLCGNKGKVWNLGPKASKEIAKTLKSIAECGGFFWLRVVVLHHDAIGWCLSP